MVVIASLFGQGKLCHSTQRVSIGRMFLSGIQLSFMSASLSELVSSLLRQTSAGESISKDIDELYTLIYRVRQGSKYRRVRIK